MHSQSLLISVRLPFRSKIAVCLQNKAYAVSQLSDLHQKLSRAQTNVVNTAPTPILKDKRRKRNNLIRVLKIGILNSLCTTELFADNESAQQSKPSMDSLRRSLNTSYFQLDQTVQSHRVWCRHLTRQTCQFITSTCILEIRMALCITVITICGFDTGLPIISSQMPPAVD